MEVKRVDATYWPDSDEVRVHVHADEHGDSPPLQVNRDTPRLKYRMHAIAVNVKESPQIVGPPPEREGQVDPLEEVPTWRLLKALEDRGGPVWMPCCQGCMNGSLTGEDLESGLCSECRA